MILENTQEPIKEEMSSRSSLKASPTAPGAQKRNACMTFLIESGAASTNSEVVLELMSAKQKSPRKEDAYRPEHVPADGRGGLYVYIASPAKHGPERVIYYNKDFVAINDLYPKSAIHTLLLPRSAIHTDLHPFDAFEDPEFLASVRSEVQKLKVLVAKELRRKFGKFSAEDAARQSILKGDVELADGDELPEGRDWLKSVKAGVHAHPSMHHLHIHIMSIDRMGESLKHRKHYNSFETGFFVPIDDFPLTADDRRRHPSKHKYLECDMKCWRCGKNFTNHFKKLQEHLAVEFEEWKKE